MKDSIRISCTIALLLTGLPMLLPVPCHAQDYCPGFRNPLSFSEGSPLLGYYWSARVGERVYPENNSDTTTGYYVMSTCASPNCPSIKGHNNIASTIYYSGSDYNISHCGHNFFDANDHRFQIITSADSGIDQFTVNGPGTGMPRIAPGYTTSIRLGDMRNTGSSSLTNHSHTWSSFHPNKGAEALFYTMFVTPENAMIFINYAIVARRYSHTAYDAGEFLIRVVGHNADGTWPNAPINDNLWYKVSAPNFNGNELPAGWYAGYSSSSNLSSAWPCTYAYKPWTKVAISLNAYIYDSVRIEMYTSDCIYNADPIYAYIAGDYQSMVLRSSGCPSPESEVVDTLTAPPSMLTYRWYVSRSGAVSDENLYNSEMLDTLPFRQVWPPNDSYGTDSVYAVRLEDFVIETGQQAGDTATEQTFMCIMTSALDPNKPFESKIYSNVTNRKPLVDYVYEPHCDGSVTFRNASIIFARQEQVDDSTRWIFYADTLGTQSMDTLYGNDVTYSFPEEGTYSVRLFVSAQGQTEGDICSAAKLFTCRTILNPPSGFTLSTRQLCENDQLIMRASDEVRQLEGVTLQWAVDDSVISETSADARCKLSVGDHVLSLTVTNADSCSSTSFDSLYVYGQPHIDLSSVTSAICQGDSVTLSAVGNISYSWNSAPYDSTVANAEGRQSFTVSPSVSTTYYLLPAEDNPCTVEGAEVYIEVIPYPTPSIRTSSPRVNIENTTVTLQDVSPYSVSSQWVFSDGGSAEGARVTHNFTDISGDSVDFTLNTCNRLDCCSDTNVHLPIEATTIWFPNTFTPDAESNNRFGPYTTLTLIEYELSVYNRQGQLVYRTTDPAAPWNGMTDSGVKAPHGVYTWFCRYAYSSDATHTARGAVTMLR